MISGGYCILMFPAVKSGYRVYRRGFDAGVESTKGKVTKRSIVPPEPVQTEE